MKGVRKAQHASALLARQPIGSNSHSYCPSPEQQPYPASLRNRIARAQAAPERELDQLLAFLPTAADLGEIEQRLISALEQAPDPRSGSWRAWWTAQPSRD